MPEFLHEIVARRGDYTPAVRREPQYSNIYRDIYIESGYAPLVYVQGSFVIPTIRRWRDSPAYDALTAIFHGVSCQHRWLFLISECTLSTWYYRCIDCHDTRTSRGNEDV
jgi:hypothetical protein